MKSILKKTALLLAPIAVYFCIFAAFEPNNYFGLRESSSGGAPIARLKSYEQQPGSRIIIGDSRLAHFDMELAESASGRSWQNLAFGGASLREGVDVLEWALDRNPDLEEVVFGLSFYTLTSTYDANRMTSLQKTLDNPFAYFFNLEYNVNMLTSMTGWVRWLADKASGATTLSWAESQIENETGDWVSPADYTGPDGTVYDLHTKLALYPEALRPRCEGWTLNREQLDRLYDAALRCRERGVKLTLVLPPMADIVLTESCQPFGIDTAMTQTVLPELLAKSQELGFALLDYEWTNRPDYEDDKQFFDGFHLDMKYGLPDWTEQLFSEIG